MRLSDLQRDIFRKTVAEIFGAGAEVWLFGSRVDDNKRGGDIDLLVKINQVDVWLIIRNTPNKFPHYYPDYAERNVALINVAGKASFMMHAILADVKNKLRGEHATLELGKPLSPAPVPQYQQICNSSYRA
jgi:hypothetical protein